MNKKDRQDVASHFAKILDVQKHEKVSIYYRRTMDAGFANPGKLAQAFADALTVGNNRPSVSYNNTYRDYLTVFIDPDKKSAKAANDNAPASRQFPFLALPILNKRFAQAAGVSSKEASQVYKKLLLQDYNKMADIAQPLHNLLASGDKVHIKSPDTDISFSIKDIGACTGRGDINCPEGEVFTAPLINSVNGTVKFGPSQYMTAHFSHITLDVKDGTVIKGYAKGKTQTDILNAILDIDGARQFGEFAIAYNPDLLYPTGSVLLDEKIKGSFHMALGKSLPTADNGNRSVVHWDMVQIQRPDFGGGEIRIDGRLIRKDGIFVVPELEALNPKNLKAALSTANDNNKPGRKPKRGPDFKLG